MLDSLLMPSTNESKDVEKLDKSIKFVQATYF